MQYTTSSGLMAVEESKIIRAEQSALFYIIGKLSTIFDCSLCVTSVTSQNYTYILSYYTRITSY